MEKNQNLREESESEDSEREEDVNQGPVDFQPLGVSLRREVLAAISRENEIRKKIQATDVEYRRKKVDPLRADLYMDLKRYFKKEPLTHMKLFLPNLSESKFERFISPDPELLKFKALDKKKKIQKLQEKNFSRDLLYSSSCRMSLNWIGKFKDKEPWEAYALSKPSKKLTQLKDLTLKAYMTAVAQSFEDMVKEVEIADYKEDCTNTLYFVHCRITEKIGYIALRIQVVPGISREERRKRRTKVTRETSQTFIFAIKQNLPHIFSHGTVKVPKDILKFMMKAMKYKEAEEQHLTGRNLSLLIQSCNRQFVVPEVVDFEKKFKEEEQEMNSRGACYGDRDGAKRTKYMCALLQDGQPPGVDTFTLHHKLPVPQSEEDPDEPLKTIDCVTKIKLNGTNPDEYFAELYRLGVITDLTPFIKMKATQSNEYVDSDEEDLE